MKELRPEVIAFCKRSIALYPRLFYLQTDEHSYLSVLEHVFFTLGNGIYWKDGKPFDPEDVELESDLIPSLEGVERSEELPSMYCAASCPYTSKLHLMNPSWLKAFAWTTKEFMRLGIDGLYNPTKYYGKYDPSKADFYDLKDDPNPLAAYLGRLQSILDEINAVLKETDEDGNF